METELSNDELKDGVFAEASLQIKGGAKAAGGRRSCCSCSTRTRAPARSAGRHLAAFSGAGCVDGIRGERVAHERQRFCRGAGWASAARGGSGGDLGAC